MKVAIQTIAWGREPSGGVDAMLASVADAGYVGVELFQHPDVLGPPAALYEMLRAHGLAYLGISGGSFADRVRFSAELTKIEQMLILGSRKELPRIVSRQNDPAYIYVDDWDQSVYPGALRAGYTLAVHPHMFKPIQTARDVEAILAAHPAARFLPDTAHLTVAGEDIVSVITRNLDRVVAVHVKDWTAEFGRARQLYSQGFNIPLGKGDVAVREVIKALRTTKYKGWIVVERDVVEDPMGDARAAREWLLALVD